MPSHDIIVIGGSAGGVEAVAALVADLPTHLPAALFVVIHFPPHSTSRLPDILARAGPLPAMHAVDGKEIAPGRIYVALPDQHLLLAPGRMMLSRGPHENGHRPAIDTLFRSAARAYGRRVIGVLLSGSLDDGTAGLQAIKMRGGLAIVQDPKTALFPGMPTSAIEQAAVDYVLPVSAIPPKLAQLAVERIAAGVAASSSVLDQEVAMASMDATDLEQGEPVGTPAVFACPECHGTLWEIQEGDLTRFRCRVGHAYSADSLLAKQSEALEAALWAALRALEEKASLADRIAERARLRHHTFHVVSRFEEQAREATDQAALVRAVLMRDKPFVEPSGQEATEQAGDKPA
jgi:two-component system chemotaxis response regulator CheB